MSEKETSLRWKWYNNLDVLREILPQVWKRDMTFINVNSGGAIRFFSVKNPFYIQQINNSGLVKFMEKPDFNMYRSVCYYKSIPDFTYNPALRSQATKQWKLGEGFRKGKYFDGYDLFFDFDVDSPDNYGLLRDEVLGFKEYLDDWHVPYYLYFSGKKGFQVVIPYKYLPQCRNNMSFRQGKANNFFSHCKGVVEKIKEVFEFSFLDLNQNGVSTRLMKVPYSLSQIDCVVLPLFESQLRNFKSPEDFHVSKVIDEINVRKRGVLEAVADLSFDEKLRNTKEFINQFGR